MNHLIKPKSPARIKKGNRPKSKKSIEKVSYLVHISNQDDGSKNIKLINRITTKNDLEALKKLVHYIVDQYDEEDLKEKIWVAKFSKEVLSAEVLAKIQPGQPLPTWKETFLAKVDSWNVSDKVLRYRKKIKKESGYMWIPKTLDTKMMLK